MKILQIISSGGMYGAEAVIVNLARTINQGPHASCIAIFDHASSPVPRLYEVARDEGIESFLIPCNRQIDLSFPQRIRDLVSQQKIDVVHAHGYKADVYTCIAFFRSTVPFIATCHNWLDTNALNRIYGALDRYALKRFRAVVAVSDDVKQRLLKAGVSQDIIRSIRNGVHTARFGVVARERQLGEPVVVGLAGRLSPEKGVDVFVSMASELLRVHPGLRFRIAGDGPERNVIEGLVRQLGMEQQVTLLGRVEEMDRFYASIDILVSSSRTEGFPMGLLEAMASGLPVVASAVGDVPKIVRDGETGFLVPPENVSALVHAVARLVADDSLRSRCGEFACVVVEEEYSARRMAAEYLRLYEDVSSARNESLFSPGT